MIAPIDRVLAFSEEVKAAGKAFIRLEEQAADQGFMTDEESAWYVRNLSRLKGELAADLGVSPDEFDEVLRLERAAHRYSHFDHTCRELHRLVKLRMAKETNKERAKAIARVTCLYQHIALAKDSLHTRGVTLPDAHFLPLTIDPGLVEKVCILLEPPDCYATKDELTYLSELIWPRQRLEGTDLDEPPPIWKELTKCQMPCHYQCDNRHIAYRGINSCKLHWHPECHNEKVKELARLELPDLRGEESYREVWFTTTVRYPNDLADWGKILKEWSDRWMYLTKNLKRRKGIKGQVYYRSMSVYYGKYQAMIRFKVMLKENTPGQMDTLIAFLEVQTRAAIVQDRRYQEWEEARLQLMADSMSHLIGFAPALEDWEKMDLLQAHVETMRGKHVFQAMGELYNRMVELPDLEVLICEECGERVNRQILEYGSPRGSEQISPTSENYVWREHREGHRDPPLFEARQGEMPLAADD